MLKRIVRDNRYISTNLIRVVVSLALIVVVSCTGGGGSSGSPIATDKSDVFDDSVIVARGTIGTAGGSVINSDQGTSIFGALIKIPEGALDKALEIQIGEVIAGPAFDSNEQNSLLVAFKPDDTIFNRPVEITVPFNQTDNLDRLAIFYFDDADSIWTQIPTVEIDTTNNTVTGLTNKLGIFTVKQSYFHFNASLYRKNGIVSTNIKLATSYYNIPLPMLGGISPAVANFGQLFDDQLENTKVRYSVQLKKYNILWLDEIISIKNSEYHVNKLNETGDAHYDLFVRDYVGNPKVYNKIVYVEPDTYDLEKIKSFYKGERILFLFDDVASLDPGGVYYLDISYEYLKGETILARGSINTKRSYLVNLNQFSYTPDDDNDRLINEFDLGASASPSPLLPSINSFTALPPIITSGETSVLTAWFSNGNGVIDNNIGEVTSGTNISVNPAVTTTYLLTVSNSEGIKVSQPLTITVNTDSTTPAINSFTAAPASIVAGESTTLMPYFSNGTGVIDNNIGDVTSGASIVVSPSVTTTYILTVDNGAGITVSQPVTITVNTGPVPSISSFNASPTIITAGGSALLTPVFSNGTGSIDNGIGGVTSGTSISVNPSVSTTYTLTVTDSAGNSVSQLTTVAVSTGTAPTIGSFSTSANRITAGESAILTPVFINGTGQIDHGIGAVSSGVGITVTPMVSTIYKLTVTNSAGIAASLVVTITVNTPPPPSINSLSATPASIMLGDSATIIPVFLNGTGNIDHGIGAVSSGVGVVVSPGATTTYTLTVTSGTGVSVSRPLTLIVNNDSAPAISEFSASPSSISAGQSAILLPIFSNGTATIDNGVGVVTSGVAISVNPSVSTIYKLTVTNSTGVVVTQSVTVTVI